MHAANPCIVFAVAGALRKPAVCSKWSTCPAQGFDHAARSLSGMSFWISSLWLEIFQTGGGFNHTV